MIWLFVGAIRVGPPDKVHDLLTNLDRINGSALAIDDLAAGGDEDGVRNGTSPFFVENVGQLITIFDGGDVIRRRSMVLLQQLERRVFLLRLVDAERHHLKV